MKQFFTTILTVLLFPSVHAQPWDMERCLDYALTHNPEVAIHQSIAEQSKSRFVAECLNVLPVFSATTYDKLTAFSVSGELTLFHGFEKHHLRRMAKCEYDISVLEILGIKEDLTIKTIEAYLHLAQSHQQLEYAKAGYEASVNEREKTLMLVNGGTQPMSALMQVEAQLASDRSALVEAECAVKSRRMELCQVMDIPYDSDFHIDLQDMSDTLSPPPHYPIHMLDAMARNNPRYKEALATVEHRKANYLKSISELFPAFSLTADYSSPFIRSKGPDIKSVGLRLSIPILSSWQFGPHIREAKQQKKQAEVESYSTLRKLQTAIERVFIESSNSYSKTVAARENVRALDESLRINRLKYEQGMITATDYILAKSEYDKARSSFLNAKWQHIFQLKIIDYYVSEYGDIKE